MGVLYSFSIQTFFFFFYKTHSRLFFYRVTIYCVVIVPNVNKKKRKKTKTKDGEIEMRNHFTHPTEHFFNLVNMHLEENSISQKITKET